MGIKRELNMIRNVKNWFGYLVYKFGGKKAESFTFILSNNFKVTVPRKIIPEFKECFFEEVYFKNLPSKILKTKNPKIIDIGANVGFFSLACIHKFQNPKVVAFEPVKRNFTELQKNITGVEISKLIAVNKAVSDLEGELVLKFDTNQSITTSASIFDNVSGNDEELVTSTTLESVINEYGFDEIDILKLDCEGSEYGIFYKTQPELFDRVKCVAMETHQGKADNENHYALAEYIKSLGFSVITKPDSLIWGYKA